MISQTFMTLQTPAYLRKACKGRWARTSPEVGKLTAWDQSHCQRLLAVMILQPLPHALIYGAVAPVTCTPHAPRGRPQTLALWSFKPQCLHNHCGLMLAGLVCSAAVRGPGTCDGWSSSTLERLGRRGRGLALFPGPALLRQVLQCGHPGVASHVHVVFVCPYSGVAADRMLAVALAGRASSHMPATHCSASGAWNLSLLAAAPAPAKFLCVHAAWWSGKVKTT